MRVLLLDSDVLVYRFAYACEAPVRWDEDTWTYYGDLGKAKREMLHFVKELVENMAADEVRHFLSDSKENWRREVYDGYKGKRSGWMEVAQGMIPKHGPRRPMLWKPMRDWLVEEHGALIVDGLEGDDLLGLEATAPSTNTFIMVSIDKDMRTVPGWHFNPDLPLDGVFQVTEEQAARYHMFQTLMGDATDGYPGCKGVGKVRAAKILDGADTWENGMWDAVVNAYERAKLTEHDALMNARVARIMQHGDYVDGEVRLWEPPK